MVAIVAVQCWTKKASLTVSYQFCRNLFFESTLYVGQMMMSPLKIKCIQLEPDRQQEYSSALETARQNLFKLTFETASALLY